jgi:hypothetical protein
MKTDSIIVLGGGSAGWMTASTLIRAFPEKTITVIESPDVPIVGVGESTLGSLRRWTKYIGLDEFSFFPYTDASFKLSIKFTDFYKKDSGSFYYPFGASQYKENNPYMEWFAKKHYFPDFPVTDLVESLHPQAQLFLNNKFLLSGQKIKDETLLTSDVSFFDDSIQVETTYGFPEKYGIIKIDDEIITYKSKTSNTFDDCVRGFSGITSLKNLNDSTELVFNDSDISDHVS